SRALTHTRHNLSAVFEVTKQGKLNLQARLTTPSEDTDPNEAAKAGWAGGPWSFELTAKGRPITAQVQHWDVREYREKSSTHGSKGVREAVTQLRVGDRVLLRCGEHVTTTTRAAAKVKQPAVELIQKAFASPGEPWREEKGK